MYDRILKCISDDAYDPVMVQATNLELRGFKLGRKVLLLEWHMYFNTGFNPPIIVWIHLCTVVKIVIEPVILCVCVEVTELLIISQRVLYKFLNESVGLRD